MSSNIYTLRELVDIALQTPEVGAVNFNVLRIVLLKILSELNLENKTAKWKAIETSTPVIKILEDKELPDHPMRTERPKDETHQESKPMSKQKTKQKDSESSMLRVESPPTIQEKPTKVSTVETEIKLTESETTTETHKSELSVSEEADKRETTQKKLEKIAEKKIEEPGTSKSMKVGTQLWQMWQVKKATKRIEAVEEILNSLAVDVDELQEFKHGREKRIKFEEGEKLQSGYGGSTISREEFEHTIDDIGEAMACVSINQRQQKDECNTISQTILKEMCLKVSFEDLTKFGEPVNRKLRTLAMAVKNIQKLIKDVIYPEACGITKCMACGRKSQLPLRCVVMDSKGKIIKNKNGLVKSAKKTGKQETYDELKFTNASLEKNRKRVQDSHLEGDQGAQSSDDPAQMSNQDRHAERPIFPECLVQLESLSGVEELSRDFAPLRRFPDLMRRKTFCIPAIRPKQAPVTVSLYGNEDSENYFRRKEM